MSKDRSSYVYAYFRPNMEPCYVGKGKKDRWLCHERYETNRRLWRAIQRNGGWLPKLVPSFAVKSDRQKVLKNKNRVKRQEALRLKLAELRKFVLLRSLNGNDIEHKKRRGAVARSETKLGVADPGAAGDLRAGQLLRAAGISPLPTRQPDL